MKIKFDIDDELSLGGGGGGGIITIAVRAVFHENNKYYPKIF